MSGITPQDFEIARLKAKTEYLDHLIHDTIESLDKKKDKMLSSTKLCLAIFIGMITTCSALIFGFVIGHWCW